MHFFACVHFKLAVKKLVVLPFGACLQVDKMEKVSSIKQIIIYMMGPLSALINLPWIIILFKVGIINEINYEKLMIVNTLMALLNLMPIFPLDGYMILKGILQLFLPYKNSLKISYITSIIFFVVFLFFNIIKFQPMVLFFLLIEQIKHIKDYKKIYKRFLIYKSLNKKEKKYKIIDNYNMYKDYNNYKIENNIILDDLKIATKELKKYL